MCDEPASIVPNTLIRTAWGADLPSNWARVDYPCAGVSIGAGSQAYGAVLVLPSGPVIVTPERPWLGDVPAGTPVRPLDTAGQAAWNPVNDHRLQLDLWPQLPRVFPGGARGCDRLALQDPIAAGGPTETVGRQWVTGREEGFIRIHAGVGACNYAFVANLFAFGTMFTATFASGAIAAGASATVQWTRNSVAADQLEFRFTSVPGTTITLIAESNDRE